MTDATPHSVAGDGPATANRVATICAYCGEPLTIATNPPGQTQIRYFHDWQCYSCFYNIERGGEPLHLVSHDEQVQDGHLFP